MHSSEIEPVDSLRASSPPRENSGLDILDLITMLAHRKRVILIVTAVATLAAAAVSFVIPKRYTATVTLMPPQQTQSTVSMLMSQLAATGLGSLASIAGGNIGLKNPNDLYIGLLKSRTVEDSIIRRFDLQQVYSIKLPSETRKALEKASEISTSKNGLIEISFEDRDPKRAADVANAYVEELKKLTQHLAVSEASQRRSFFEQQVSQAKEELANAEVALKETQQKTGMIQLDSQARVIIESVGRLRAQIAAKEVEIQAMRSFATSQNPDLVLADEQLSGMRAQLAKVEREQSSSPGDPFLATAKVPAAALEYVRRLRELKYREVVFELMAKQFEAAKLDEAKQAAVIQVVDSAIPPDHKSSPKRLKIVLITAGLFFLIACMYVISEGLLALARRDSTLAIKLGQLQSAFGTGADDLVGAQELEK